LKVLELGDWILNKGNKITQISPKISQLKNLSIFDVSSNQLSKFPEEVKGLENLFRLDISSNQLSEFPEEVKGLENLSVFYLSSNQLSEFPEEVKGLENLSILYIISNRLSQFPHEVKGFGNLSELYLSSNQLSEFPEEVQGLENLSRLDISSNQLSKFPEEVKGLENLSVLYLSSNQLSEFPEEVQGLENLSVFDLSSNQLSKFPEKVKGLENLSELYLSSNQLSKFPEEVKGLENLSVLYLSSNQLSKFPEKVKGLENLSRLYLNSNQLKIIPSSILDMPNLEIFEIDENPLEGQSKELIGMKLEDIKQVLREQRKAKKEGKKEVPINELKLLLVGEERAGKSTIAEALSTPDFVFKEGKKSTEGIDVVTWNIDKETMQCTDGFRVNIWDFGGQEIYHATHQFFLTKQSIYFLVTEARRDVREEDAYYWLNIIRLLGEQSPIVLVQNKCDQPYKPLAFERYKELVPNVLIVDHFDVSCQRAEDIQRLKEKVYELLKDKNCLPELGITVPKVYADIRKRIEEERRKGKDYISHQEYVAICAEFDRGDVADKFSGYYHRIGVFLHFKDDIKLKDTIFLNYNWVIDAMYNVLDNQKIINNDGYFDQEDLKEIWSDVKYKNKQAELLYLMNNNRFDLCFEVDEKTKTYLAPQLLPEERVDCVSFFKDKSLFFEYRYTFMPKGILSRFIVKLNRYIHKTFYWKYGVLLSYENTFAIVREYYSLRKITIQIEGTNEKEFLGIIRGAIKEINDDFPGLEVSEWIPCNCDSCRISSPPYYFEYRNLRERIGYKKRTIECGKPPFNEVSINELLNNIKGSNIEKSLNRIVGNFEGLHSEVRQSKETIVAYIDERFRLYTWMNSKLNEESIKILKNISGQLEVMHPSVEVLEKVDSIEVLLEKSMKLYLAENHKNTKILKAWEAAQKLSKKKDKLGKLKLSIPFLGLLKYESEVSVQEIKDNVVLMFKDLGDIVPHLGEETWMN